MKKAIKYLAHTLYRPLLSKYLSKERMYRYGDIRLSIHPDIFHPAFFHSTKILLKQVRSLPLKGKYLLELGAGSGLISFAAAKSGASVTASDINRTAVAYLLKNQEKNLLKLNAVESDLFDNIPRQKFDLIIINPPYYFKNPGNQKEYAWYCGENGEYFQRLFHELSNYMHENSVTLMVLCDDCKCDVILSMAAQAGLVCECIKTVSSMLEENYVYQIRPARDLSGQMA